jgi:lysophospholipase L1-like esterase
MAGRGRAQHAVDGILEPLALKTVTRCQRALINCCLLLASTLFALLVAEVGTRVILGDAIVLYPRYFTAAAYDGVTLRRLVPNSSFWHTSTDGSWEFRTNSKGFRDDENYEYDKPAGTRRVLVLGDSQTQGLEVRQSATFAKVLERRLRERGVDAQVLNTGISGFGTAEELMFLEHEGMKYHPDAIVLAFFENDFDDSVKSGLYGLRNGELVVRKTEHIPGVNAIALMNAIPGGAWLSQNSYLFSLFVNTVWETVKRGLSIAASKQLVTEYAISTSEVGRYERDLVVTLIERMNAVAHAASIPFVIVEIPSPDVSKERAWLPSVPDDLVPAFISACNVLLPAKSYLNGAQNGTILVPHGYGHISEQTHTRIAEALDHVLSEQVPGFGRHHPE